MERWGKENNILNPQIKCILVLKSFYKPSPSPQPAPKKKRKNKLFDDITRS